MVIYAERASSGASSLPKEKMESLLADHERRGLKSFTISPR
jgi:hypothetical protein